MIFILKRCWYWLLRLVTTASLIVIILFNTTSVWSSLPLSNSKFLSWSGESVDKKSLDNFWQSAANTSQACQYNIMCAISRIEFLKSNSLVHCQWHQLWPSGREYETVSWLKLESKHVPLHECCAIKILFFTADLDYIISSLGYEYEFLLQENIHQLGIPFLGELQHSV